MVRTLLHLTGRFFGSLSRRPISPDDVRFVASQLGAGEQALWDQMSAPDQRHAVAVAREAEQLLGVDATTPVMAAALLHDVGKVDAAFGTFSRVGATVIGAIATRDRIDRWAAAPGVRGRLGRYLCHDEIGARLLAGADSDDLTVRWAREHHLPPQRWTLSRPIADALKAADDD